MPTSAATVPPNVLVLVLVLLEVQAVVPHNVQQLATLASIHRSKRCMDGWLMPTSVATLPPKCTPQFPMISSNCSRVNFILIRVGPSITSIYTHDVATSASASSELLPTRHARALPGGSILYVKRVAATPSFHCDLVLGGCAESGGGKLLSTSATLVIVEYI
jgi:hypothetical protein